MHFSNYTIENYQVEIFDNSLKSPIEFVSV